MFDIAAVCIVITALLAYVNHRFFGLPMAIGVMASALALSLVLIGLDTLDMAHDLRVAQENFVASIDFSEVLLQGMLSVLLFAAALRVKLHELKAFRWQIGALALLGTLLSTFLVGIALWFAVSIVDLRLSLLECFVFGALISPTDPVAVIGILKSASAPKDLETVITGESLFNDGVGIVIFSLLVGMAISGDMPATGDAVHTLIREAGGGLLFGWVLGYVTYRMLRSTNEYKVEVMLTLAAVTGGYALTSYLHVSGPLAMVVAGLMIGNRGRDEAMTPTSRAYIDMFWGLLDEILNAVLFVLIGMEALIIAFPAQLLLAGAIAILVTLLARLLSVGLPVAMLGRFINLPPGSWRVLAWSGLRGGISVALALSLPAGPSRGTLVALTYCVVVFSILVQGLSFARVVRRSVGS
ncbi:MAG: sodium:proton antiporter [Rhodocyclales bacterium]|nr:sodium:proton antiporter [Rhodocyclales bacterium]